MLDRLPGFFLLIARRQQYHRGLVLLALLGVILSVGLVTNASFFSQAVDRVILEQNLAEFSRETGRPPFSTNVYVFPSAQTPLTLQDSERMSRQIGDALSSEVALPLRQLGLEISSGSMLLQPVPSSDLYGQGRDLLGSVSIIDVADIASRMELEAGAPIDDSKISGKVLDIWMHDRLAQEMGIQIDDQMIVRPNVKVDPVVVRVAGLWHAKDPQDEFWFGDPDGQLKGSLLVRRNDYVKFIQPMVASGSREASWYVILDDHKIIPKDSASYLAGFQRGQDRIATFLPDVRLNTPPLTPLRDFVQRSDVLTIILLGYDLPAFAILLYFLLLISSIIAQWQSKETAILTCRGMSISGILRLTFLEQLLLFVIGYPLGIVFGLLIARVMGYIASFLTFTGRAPLPVSMQGFSFPLTLLALSVSLFSRLWPVVRASRQSIVTEEHEWSRPSQGPFWYRYYLDFLLIIPTYYIYLQMRERGSLASVITSRPEDLYQDPLLIVVPALFVITAALVTMRLFSVAMRLLDALANRTPWLTAHLALRQLGRQSHEYVSPLLLVIISLSLGIYTLSMAASLDQWLVDRMYYRAGADMTFTPLPVTGDVGISDGNWVAAPQEFSKVDGVLSATRVGNYPSRITLAGGEETLARFMAIDRVDFPLVAWWRADLASEPLGGLMNRLALAPDGILVSQKFLTSNSLQIGDQISIQVDATEIFKTKSLFTIVGVYDYFPTVYEEQRITVIGNLEQLTSLFGFVPIHDIWQKTEPTASEADIRKALPGTVNLVPSVGQDARILIAEERGQMERVGIFGTLTVGFLASATMAILGLLLYSYASLRDRMYRFSVLHAVGLLHRQIVTQVVMEYTFLAAFGALAGALIGMLASQFFVPYFRVTGEKGIPLPPLIPLTSDQSMANLAIIFTMIIVAAEVSTITSALRRKLVRIR
ncbi:MAG TPA: ABC transporter permease [Anaerolineales bacterium]|nr:ABC transporter permease [Anaerolineales bacterium]